jgi:hypothetical protein
MSLAEQHWDNVAELLSCACGANPQSAAVAWEELLGPPSALTAALTALLAQAIPERPHKVVAECWDQLCSAKASASLSAWIDTKQRGDSQDEDRIDAARLWCRVKGHVASGLAAVWAGRVGADVDAPRELGRWLALTAGGPAVAAKDGAWPREPEAALRQAAQSLTGCEVADARERALAWLGCPSAPVRPALRFRLVAASRDQQSGTAYSVCLEQLDAGPGELLEHGDLWNRLLGGDFLTAIRAAREAAWPEGQRPAVRWSIAAPANRAWQPLTGRSAGLAFQVGFRLLAEGVPHDADVVFSAAVTADQRTGPVSGLRAKAAALVGSARRFVVSTSAAFAADRNLAVEDLTEAEVSEFRQQGLDVLRAGNVEEAFVLATQTVSALRDYLDELAAFPDQPAARNEKPLKDLYVCPHVLTTKLEDERRRASRTIGMQSKPGMVSPEHLDSGDAEAGQLSPDERFLVVLRREYLDSSERLSDGDSKPSRPIAWVPVRQDFDAPGRRAVLVGPPGQGKTTLLRVETARLAEQARARLHDPEAVPLPVYVPLPRLLTRAALLARSQRPEGEDFLVGCLLEELPQRLRERLLATNPRRLNADRVWLFLDGLDEVEEQDRGLLLRLLDALEEWPARVLVGTRRYGLDGYRDDLARRWSENAPTYHLAPFDTAQLRTFVTGWLGIGHREQQLREQIDRSPTLRMLARNPYLLKLLCIVATRREVPANATRCDLYRWFLEELLDERFEAWIAFLAETAARMVWHNAKRPALLGYVELKERLGNSGHRPELRAGLKTAEYTLPERTGILADELCSRGLRHDRTTREYSLSILVPADDGKNLVFPHRSMAEYLTARHLAERINDPRCGWDGALPDCGGLTAHAVIQTKSWQPEWAEVVCFLAGLLKDPEALLRRLALFGELTNEERSLDASTTLLVAGRCLSELKLEQIEEQLGLQIAWAVCGIWEQSRCSDDFLDALNHPWGKACLRHILMDDANNRALFTDVEWAVEENPELYPLIERGATIAAAALALGKLQDAEAVVWLLWATKDIYRSVREAAWEALGSLGDDCTPALVKARDHEIPHVRSAAEAVLRQRGR